MYAPVTPRVGEATANSVLGLSTSGLEYKELVAGAGVSIAHTVGAIILTVAASEHVHNISELATEVIVSNDYISFWDNTAPAAPKKITFSNLEAALTHNNLIAGTIASHDTSATGAQLDTLTDDSMADDLHRHSELVASDGDPDPALIVDADGKVGVNEATPFSGSMFEVNGNIKCGEILLGFPETAGVPDDTIIGQIKFDGGSEVENRNMALFRGIKIGEQLGAFKAMISTPSGYVDAIVLNGTEVGFNTDTPDARVEIQTETDEGKQAVTIDQNDIDQAFIDFQGESEAGSAKNLSSWTGGNSIQGFVLQEINGTERWMPFFDAPTGTSGGDTHNTTATGANLTSLTDDSMVDSLHRHSELSASDGTPNPALQIDASGNVGVGRAAGARVEIAGLSGFETQEVVLNLNKRNDADRSWRFLAGKSADAEWGSYSLRIYPYTGGINGDFVIGVGVGDLRIGTGIADTADATTNWIEKITMLVSGYFGVGATTPDARFEVETISAEGQQALTIDQNDADEAFIDFQGTSAASAANNLSTWTNATLNGFVRIEINGVEKWMPYYNPPTS